ncbi:MAG TPA: hypothetical protein VFY29_08315 [Terriglobia bacterium]|nr:hypothetical protein [Terriglobia bacterium]
MISLTRFAIFGVTLPVLALAVFAAQRPGDPPGVVSSEPGFAGGAPGAGVPGGFQRGRGRGRGAPQPAAPITLEAKLVLGKDTYTITADQTGDEFRRRIRAGGRGGAMPAPPDVDMTLELKNNGNMPVTFAIDSDASSVNLALEGPGAVTADSNMAMTMEFRLGRPLTVAPGETYSIPIKSLRFGIRNIGKMAYWTEPGEYTLTASYITHPPNQSDQQTTITAPPVQIQVKLAGKA